MRHFSIEEFRCKCGCGVAVVDHDFGVKLDLLRESMGEPLKVNSGYRCPVRNLQVSSTGKNGPHTTGKAADIFCPDRLFAFKLVGLAFQLGFKGIGVSLADGSAYYVHLDTLDEPRPRMWSY
jgi:zinc D-Ala-D-Ala carboxypeptidase